MTGALVFDIETVPDLPRLRAAGAVAPDLGDDEAYAALAAAERPPKPPFCRVVAVAAAWIDPDGGFKGCGPIGAPDADERALVARWFDVVRTRRPRLVGWNSSGFDVPVLLHRAVVLGVPAAAFYGAEAYRRRYDEQAHIDLMDLLSGYGAAPRVALHEMAAACGFPGKGDTRGGDVLALWRAGDTARIRAYCARDALVTALLYGRYAAHRGWWDPGRADRFEAGVRRWLAAQTDPAWAAFAAEWDPAARVWGGGDAAGRAPA